MVEPWLAGLWEAFDKSCGPSIEDEATASSSSDGGPENSPVVQLVAEPERKNHADLQRHLPTNLISYEAMFGPLTGPTEVPDDLPRLQSALFSTQYINEPANEGSVAGQDGPAVSQEDEEPSLSKPFLGSVVGVKYLTSSQSERKVMSMEIDLGESGIRFKPGDSIGIKCSNVTDEVDILLARLDLDGAKRVAVEAAAPGRTTKRAVASLGRYPASIIVRDLFLHHTDIRSSPKKAVLRVLATYCSDEEERAELLLLSSKLGGEKYQVR
jgi:sulfite reductase alpha subunit-like flavoprotein